MIGKHILICIREATSVAQGVLFSGSFFKHAAPEITMLYIVSSSLSKSSTTMWDTEADDEIKRFPKDFYCLR